MNNKILKKQYEISNTAQWSLIKDRWELKEKHLKKLEEQVHDFVENNFYWSKQEDLNYITRLITTGLIEEVLSGLDFQG